jgi:hypothetical protein
MDRSASAERPLVPAPSFASARLDATLPTRGPDGPRAWKAGSNHVEALDCVHGDRAAVARVEVGHAVLLEEHLDRDPVEAADRRHATMLTRVPDARRAISLRRCVLLPVSPSSSPPAMPSIAVRHPSDPRDFAGRQHPTARVWRTGYTAHADPSPRQPPARIAGVWIPNSRSCVRDAPGPDETRNCRPTPHCSRNPHPS